MPTQSAKVYTQAFFAGLRPEAELSAAEWANKHRYLTQSGSAEPGRYRIERTPFLEEILECLSVTSDVREVVFIKGAQIGATESACCWLGYIMHHAPGPALMVQPTVDLAKRASKQRIAPMIEASPALRERVLDARVRDSGNTMLSKEFPGGMLVIAGANSAAGLRSMPVRFLVLDEVDAYPDDIDGEGSAVDLAKARTRTFARNKKIFQLSTPTYKGSSKIEASFEDSDKRRYELPCPHCSKYQWLKWKGIKWDKDERGKPIYKSARYECEHCNEAILEHHKTKMLKDGKWCAEEPGRAIAGFHLSALYSPLGWYSWAEAVEDWYKAQKDTDKLKTFINTVLGETFELKSEDTPEWKPLYHRRENYDIGIVPEKASLITCGVDVQKDRLEATIIGWKERESWIIDHRVIGGDTSKPISAEPWKTLSQILYTSLPTASGGVADIRMMAVDTGYNTARVYDWVRTQDPARVMAIKGTDELPMAIGTPKGVDVKRKGKKLRSGIRLWPLGVSFLKSDVYGRLKQPRPTDTEIKELGFPSGFIHFPMLSEEYFRQLVSEQLIIGRTNKGYSKPAWVKTYANNETLDCFVYGLAAYYALGANRWDAKRWEGAKHEILSSAPKTEAPTSPAPKPRKKKRRESSFL